MFTIALLTAERILAILTVFLMPTQLALHFWPAHSFVFGIRVDYLSPTIYLTDILIALLMMCWVINDGKPLFVFLKKYKQHLLLFLLLIIINLFFSTSFPISMFRWLKVVEFVLFALYVNFRKSFVGEKTLFKTLFISSVCFSVIGVSQFFLGRTTGIFYFLGERSFSLTTPGIALMQYFGQNLLRIYSTFPHPNSFAGYLGVALMFCINHYWQNRTSMFYFGLLVITIAFILTFSISAYLAICFAFLVFFTKPKTMAVKIFFSTLVLASLLLPIFSGQNSWRIYLNKNILERLDLSTLSGKMISNRFAVGEGLGTFIMNIPKFNKEIATPWLLQPVHNIFLLIFAETGIVGFLIFGYFVHTWLVRRFNFKNSNLTAIAVFVLTTGVFDHYWATIQQNLLLISFIVGLSLFSNKLLN